MTHLHFTLTYPAHPDIIYTMLCDETYLMAHAHKLPVDVLSTSTRSQDEEIIVDATLEPRKELPAPARMIVGQHPQIMWRHTWHRSTQAPYRGELTISSNTDRIVCHGTHTLRLQGTQCLYDIDLEIKIKNDWTGYIGRHIEGLQARLNTLLQSYEDDMCRQYLMSHPNLQDAHEEKQ